MSFMKDNAYKFPSTRTRGALKQSLYAEMWYFEFYDEKRGIEFVMNCCINNPRNNLLGRVFGFPASSDLLTCIAVDSMNIRRANLDTFFKEFNADTEGLDVNIGNVVFIQAIDDKNILFYGRDDSVGLSFNLLFERDMIEIPDMKTFVSRRRNDIYWYSSSMPRAIVSGWVNVDGNVFDVNCYGYHDHDWGSPTNLAWAPWSIATVDDFGIMTYVSNGIGFLLMFHDGKWMKFPDPKIKIEKYEKISYIGRGDKIVEFERPVEISVFGGDNIYQIMLLIYDRNNDFFNLDVGIDKKNRIHSTSIISTGYKTDVLISKNGIPVHVFTGLKSSFHFFEVMDYLKIF